MSNNNSNKKQLQGEWWVGPPRTPPPRHPQPQGKKKKKAEEAAASECERDDRRSDGCWWLVGGKRAAGRQGDHSPNKLLKMDHPPPLPLPLPLKGTSAGGGGAELPVIRCPCDGGACRVFTSHTDKNPGRRYYTCPRTLPQRCGFFKWCDDVLKHPVPSCPCAAGTSSLNRHLSGPYAGRWYFACRIKKNHGACTFYRMVQSELNYLLNKFLPRLEPNSSQPCSATPPTAENVDSRKEQEETNSELPAMPNSSGDEHTIDQTDLVIMKGTASLVPFMARADRTSQLMLCKSEVHLPQRKFWKQVCAADNYTSAAENFGQLLGIKFDGWLGRIAFPPPRLLKDPPALSFFWCVLPSFCPIPCLEDEPLADAEEVVTMTSHERSNNQAEPLTQLLLQAPQHQNDLPLSSTPRELLADAELVTMATDGVDDADAELQQAPQRQNDLPYLSEPCGVGSSASTKDEEALSELVLRCSGPGGVLTLLQSMSVSDHGKMVEVAESIFDSWRRVGVDCGPFSQGVKEYVHYVSRQAGVEALMSKEGLLSSRQLDAIYLAEKAEFDHACERHREMDAALEASEKHEKSMQGEASRIRDRLMRLDKEIAEHEARNAELRSRVAELCKEKEDAEARMEAACVKMREVLELEQELEMEKKAASGVMERLRGLLY